MGIRLREELPQRSCAGLSHSLLKIADALLDDSFFLLVPVGLAVALEATPLGEMVECAAKLVGL